MNDATLVAVYEFEVFDKAARCWKLSSRVGTREAIESIGGVPVRSSVLMVDRARLDERGFLGTAGSG